MFRQIVALTICSLYLQAAEVADIYFSSEDSIEKKLIEMIDNEQSKIEMAIYRISDQKVGDALVRALDRGVEVKVVTNRESPSEAFRKMKEAKLDITIYQKEGTTDLMNHKFALFHKNKNDNAFVWTGSTDFTQVAASQHRENVVVLSGEDIFSRYAKEFASIK